MQNLFIYGKYSTDMLFFIISFIYVRRLIYSFTACV